MHLPDPDQAGLFHIVGIGGIGMSAIAEVMHTRGFSVQGSDLKDGVNLERLREGFWQYLPLGAVVGVLMALEMALLLVGAMALLGPLLLMENPWRWRLRVALLPARPKTLWTGMRGLPRWQRSSL